MHLQKSYKYIKKKSKKNEQRIKKILTFAAF